jgi:hypothetical protein
MLSDFWEGDAGLNPPAWPLVTAIWDYQSTLIIVRDAAIGSSD